MSRFQQPMRSRSRESEKRDPAVRVTFDEERIRKDRVRNVDAEEGVTEKTPLKEPPQSLPGKGNQKGGGKMTEEEKAGSPRKGYWQRRKQRKKNSVSIRDRSPTPHPSGARRVSIERR